MRLFKQFLVAIITVLCTVSMSAQDIHFSQFYMAPMHLNPAMTGVMNCNARLIGNYRNQWASVLKADAYSTYAFSYDMRMPVGRHDFFGWGFSFWGDKAGSGDLTTLKGKMAGSYSKRMGGYRQKNHYLVVGADAGVAQRSLDFYKLQWGTQYNGDDGHDPTAPSLEDQFDLDNYLYVDLSAGLLWFTVLDENTNFYLGGAFSHLTRANQSFDSDTYEGLYSKFTGHAGGQFMFSKKVGLVPNLVLLAQGPSMELAPGTAIKFRLGKNPKNYQAFSIGGWFRISNNYQRSITPDAAILAMRFDYENFSLGFSYDVNVSEFKVATNSNGAFEFALQYKICKGFNRGVYCPNF